MRDLLAIESAWLTELAPHMCAPCALHLRLSLLLPQSAAVRWVPRRASDTLLCSCPAALSWQVPPGAAEPAAAAVTRPAGDALGSCLPSRSRHCKHAAVTQCKGQATVRGSSCQRKKGSAACAVQAGVTKGERGARGSRASSTQRAAEGGSGGSRQGQDAAHQGAGQPHARAPCQRRRAQAPPLMSRQVRHQLTRLGL